MRYSLVDEAKRNLEALDRLNARAGILQGRAKALEGDILESEDAIIQRIAKIGTDVKAAQDSASEIQSRIARVQGSFVKTGEALDAAQQEASMSMYRKSGPLDAYANQEGK